MLVAAQDSSVDTTVVTEVRASASSSPQSRLCSLSASQVAIHTRGHARNLSRRHARAIISMKRNRFEPLRRAMADLLGQQLLLEPQHTDALPLLIPVPYHWSHAFSSSTNTAELLAQGIATTSGWPIAQRIVRRIRKTSKQGMLSWAERKTNVRHAFSVKSPMASRDARYGW
ncbi:MAG: hypothetical protein R3C56_20275 [Pirellulaceae bacterium]